jgi:uncharacterized protein (DUF4415 family)
MNRRAKATKSRRIATPRAGQGAAKQHFLMGEIGRLYKPIKQPVTLRLDADVLAWFKKQGRGYQTRINGALRKVMVGVR